MKKYRKRHKFRITTPNLRGQEKLLKLKTTGKVAKVYSKYNTSHCDISTKQTKTK
jgi:hypothetical protein